MCNIIQYLINNRFLPNNTLMPHIFSPTSKFLAQTDPSSKIPNRPSPKSSRSSSQEQLLLLPLPITIPSNALFPSLKFVKSISSIDEAMPMMQSYDSIPMMHSYGAMPMMNSYGPMSMMNSYAMMNSYDPMPMMNSYDQMQQMSELSALSSMLNSYPAMPMMNSHAAMPTMPMNSYDQCFSCRLSDDSVQGSTGVVSDNSNSGNSSLNLDEQWGSDNDIEDCLFLGVGNEMLSTRPSFR